MPATRSLRRVRYYTRDARVLKICCDKTAERFPHKPYINEDFPKNVTALINHTAIFRCPIVSDLEPYIQWVKVAEYPGNQEDSPKGILLQVQPPFVAVEGPDSL